MAFFTVLNLCLHYVPVVFYSLIVSYNADQVDIDLTNLSICSKHYCDQHDWYFTSEHCIRDHHNLSTYHTPEEERPECKKVLSEYADLNFSYHF